MKRRIFWSAFFTLFLRLQIYEAIAATFWQAASYVQLLMFSNGNLLDAIDTNRTQNNVAHLL